jgi:hypothetical protein
MPCLVVLVHLHKLDDHAELPRILAAGKRFHRHMAKHGLANARHVLLVGADLQN